MRKGIEQKVLAAVAIIIIIVAVAAGFYLKGGQEQGGGEQAQPYKVIILTGSTTGTYYPFGQTYAKYLNKYSNGKIDARALEGRASVANIKALCEENKGNAALAQNDIAYYAYHGSTIDAFKGKPEKCIRAIGVLYPETIQIVVLKDSGINTIYDLAGKKVAVGAEGSGTYWNARQILEAAGIWDQVIKEYKSFKEVVEDLKLRNIDAAFYTAGIPTSSIEQLAAEADIKLVEVPDEIYQALKQQYPFYIQQIVPAGTYEDLDQDVKTVAVMSMLIVKADVPNDVAYLMTKILYEHAQEIANEVGKTSVKYVSLDHALEGLSIPLHPGAYQYYQEKGLQVPDEFKPPSS